MTLDEVAAEPILEPNRAFQIYNITDSQLVEIGSFEGLSNGICLPPAIPTRRKRETAAVHSDRCTGNRLPGARSVRSVRSITEPSSSTIPVNTSIRLPGSEQQSEIGNGFLGPKPQLVRNSSAIFRSRSLWLKSRASVRSVTGGSFPSAPPCYFSWRRNFITTSASWSSIPRLRAREGRQESH